MGVVALVPLELVLGAKPCDIYVAEVKVLELKLATLGIFQ